MDFLAIAAVLFFAVGGVAYDVYEHPRTVIVNVAQHGDDTGTGLDKGLVAGVVQNELDRMATVPSLLAQPHIRPSEEKGFVQALGEATGTGPFLELMTSAFQARADALNIGVYSDGGKFKAVVFGTSGAVPGRTERFDITLTQRDGESSLTTVRRATVAGAERIDPYLAMLYQLNEWERTGDSHYGDAALAMAKFTKQRIPPNVGLLLVARMENVEGLLHLRGGDLDQATAAFADGLTHVPAGNIGPTPVILHLNKAFVEIAHNNPDAAAADLAEVNAITGNFDKLVGINVATTEEQPFKLSAHEVDILRSAADALAAGVALRQSRLDDAELLLKRALVENPTQFTAMSMQADIAAIRGDATAEADLRKTAIERALSANPYLEIALVHATLSFTANAVTLKPPIGVKW